MVSGYEATKNGILIWIFVCRSAVRYKNSKEQEETKKCWTAESSRAERNRGDINGLERRRGVPGALGGGRNGDKRALDRDPGTAHTFSGSRHWFACAADSRAAGRIVLLAFHRTRSGSKIQSSCSGSAGGGTVGRHRRGLQHVTAG